jgi:acetolactate synthase-1/2/3 large subunit
MKLSDAVFEFLAKKGLDQCFAVSGGAAAHLFDSISKIDINVVHMHHEQACAMAADGYARIAKKPALVLLTNGPGISNAITGVLGAFQDSIPMIVISGQVPTRQMLVNSGGVQRQSGVQEVDAFALVNSIVKYFTTVSKAEDISEAINSAWNKATTGRPGPVWIEIPLDIQSKQIDPIKANKTTTESFDSKYDQVETAINNAKKPLVIIGGGVHTSGSEREIVHFASKMGIPIVSTWGANDIFEADDDLYIGNFGILGNRIANYAVQKADLLIILGSRLSIPNTGYQTELFSPNSTKIMINLDEEEMSKPSLKIQLQIKSDLKSWLANFIFFEAKESELIREWCTNLKDLQENYSLAIEEKIQQNSAIDAYEVVEILSSSIASNATAVTDMGTSFTCTMQAFKNLRKTRLFTSSGTSSMGFGLPGAIGAYFADRNRPIYLIAGDGGFQMNIQELQTVVFHKIPIKIIILNSNGYLAITIMQQNLFEGNHVGSDPKSGVDSPNFCSIAQAYGIESTKILSKEDLLDKLQDFEFLQKPYLMEIEIPSEQLMRPRSQSLKREDGSLYSQGIEVMWPYLDVAQLKNIEDRLR